MIAIEPLIVCSVFAVLAIAIVARHRPDAFVWAPIFSFAALIFALYAIVLMISPIRALLHTFSPIYIVDGFVRYRGPDFTSDPQSNGYIAVLDDQRRQVCEWSTFGHTLASEVAFPALVEFTPYGGVRSVDGRATGVVPESLPFSVGRPQPNSSPTNT